MCVEGGEGVWWCLEEEEDAMLALQGLLRRCEVLLRRPSGVRLGAACEGDEGREEDGSDGG